MQTQTDNIILFDDNYYSDLFPFTFTRPSCEIRIGILTIKEKWEAIMDTLCSHFTRDYLSKKYPLHQEDDNILINGRILPDDHLLHSINMLQNHEALVWEDTLIAVKLNKEAVNSFDPGNVSQYKVQQNGKEPLSIRYPWHIFSYNGVAIARDFERLTQGRTSANISNTNQLFGSHECFAEEGSKLEYVTINTENGPVYIGSNAEIMEGTVIRGPFAICNHAVVKLAAKIYGPTTLGPYVKAGGELNNVVFFGYSNKAHDGFIGNAVIGEWCNIGADSNCSNLKNNYKEVKVWNYTTQRFVNTGLQFCGLLMGDHSKCGINTMFNTGTVVGVSANIFGDGFPRTFIPSFSWGGANGFKTYQLNKALEVAELVMNRRGQQLNDAERQIFQAIFEESQQYRKD